MEQKIPLRSLFLSPCSFLLLFLLVPLALSAKSPKRKKNAPEPVEYYDLRIEGGLVSDTIRRTQHAEPGTQNGSDSLFVAADSLDVDSLPNPELQTPNPENRYSFLFADTMPISRMTLISMAVPGFSQLHNKQYWKIPLAWGTLGASIYGFSQTNKPYKQTKRIYDDLIAHNASRDQIDPVQSRMIRQNTQRQLMMAAIYASWVYFVADGAINYPGNLSSVKKATTLSTILPGAGQFYNGSYWKIPIVVGAFASFGYMIDWNNRGFQRFKTAYDLLNDDDDTTIDEFDGRHSADYLRNLRNSYRRNRDLCIIVTAGLYILQIIDAHADAHLRDYDVSDDLSMSFSPTTIPLYTHRAGGTTLPGFSLSIYF